MTTHAHPEPIRLEPRKITTHSEIGGMPCVSVREVYEITPDIARQIVAMAGIPALEGERINGLEARLAALEAHMKRDTDAVAQAVADLEDDAKAQPERFAQPAAPTGPMPSDSRIVITNPDACSLKLTQPAG